MFHNQTFPITRLNFGPNIMIIMRFIGRLDDFILLYPRFCPFVPFLAPLLPKMVSIMSQHNLVTVSHWYSFVIWIRQQNWPQKQRKIAFIHCFMAETGLNCLLLPPKSITDVYNLVEGQCDGLVYHFISIPISFIFIQVWETQFFMPMPI